MKSSKSKGKNNARHEKVRDQHPAAGPGLSGALGSLLNGGEENMGQQRLVRLHAGKGTGMGKTNAVMLGGG